MFTGKNNRGEESWAVVTCNGLDIRLDNTREVTIPLFFCTAFLLARLNN